MPVFNGGAFIERAIASIQTQTEQSWELIVVDDASTDCTGDIIRRETAKDGRIRPFQNQTNLGQAQNWNECLRHAQGKWIGFLPADDVYRSQTLEKIRGIGGDSNIVLCIHAHNSSHANGCRDLVRPIADSKRFPLSELAGLFYLRGNIFGEMSCFFVRRDIVLSVPGGFGKNCSTLDLDFWMRIALRNSALLAEYSPEILSEASIHDAADSSRYNRDGRNWVDFFQFLEKYSSTNWAFGIRIRQALRAVYCLARYGVKLPCGEFRKAARSVWKVVATVLVPVRNEN